MEVTFERIPLGGSSFRERLLPTTTEREKHLAFCKLYRSFVCVCVGGGGLCEMDILVLKIWMGHLILLISQLLLLFFRNF